MLIRYQGLVGPVSNGSIWGRSQVEIRWCLEGKKALMSSLYALAASAALFLPFLGQVSAEPVTPAPQCAMGEGTMGEGAMGEGNGMPSIEPAQHGEPSPSQLPLPISQEVSASTPLDAFYSARKANQVRIERRVTIRIAPYRQSSRNSLLAQLPRRGVTSTFEEREMSECVPVAGIAGVQTGTGNRLLLFLRDQRIISLNLERGCEARDFYSGFYVERNKDGRLCVKRDQLQSRSGAKCEVERMRRLVKAED